MHVSSFAQKVASLEGGKQSINIAQINEVLRIVDDLTMGVFYGIIRLMPEPRKSSKP